MTTTPLETFDLETIKTTLSTHVSVGRKCDQLSARALELSMFGRLGYQLMSTLMIEGDGTNTILDTLQRRKTE